MQCESCGARVKATQKFCGACGAEMPATETGPFAEAKDYARDVVREGKHVAADAAKLAKGGLKTETGKSVAACAALGAIIAVPIPIVGPLLGAAVGAGIGFIRKL